MSDNLAPSRRRAPVPGSASSCARGRRNERIRKMRRRNRRRRLRRGVCNVIMPSFTSDLQALNEKAIRHDVRRNIELGFWGALLSVGVRHRVRRLSAVLGDLRRRSQGPAELWEFTGPSTHESKSSPPRRRASQSASADCCSAIPTHSIRAPRTNSTITLPASPTRRACRSACSRDGANGLFSRATPPKRLLAQRCWRARPTCPNVVAVKYEVGRPGIAGNLRIP